MALLVLGVGCGTGEVDPVFAEEQLAEIENMWAVTEHSIIPSPKPAFADISDCLPIQDSAKKELDILGTTAGEVCDMLARPPEQSEISSVYLRNLVEINASWMITSYMCMEAHLEGCLSTIASRYSNYLQSFVVPSESRIQAAHDDLLKSISETTIYYANNEDRDRSEEVEMRGRHVDLIIKVIESLN